MLPSTLVLESVSCFRSLCKPWPRNARLSRSSNPRSIFTHGFKVDLGDLLAEAISKPHWHRFIVETHSEHLLLRLQRLVREKKLSPKEVAVIYVSRCSMARCNDYALMITATLSTTGPAAFSLRDCELA